MMNPLPTDQLANALFLGARTPTGRAAVHLLTSLDGWYDRENVQRRFYTDDGDLAVPLGAVRVRWSVLATDITRVTGVSTTAGQWRVLTLACSLAIGESANLGWALSGLDARASANVLRAVAIALGRDGDLGAAFAQAAAVH